MKNRVSFILASLLIYGTAAAAPISYECVLTQKVPNHAPYETRSRFEIDPAGPQQIHNFSVGTIYSVIVWDPETDLEIELGSVSTFNNYASYELGVKKASLAVYLPDDRSAKVVCVKN